MFDNSHTGAQSSPVETPENNLRDTQLRLAILIGNLKNVVLYETGGGREFITQNIFNLLGYPPEKFTEDRNFFPSLIHSDDSVSLDILHKQWIKDGAKDTLKLEFRCKKSNNEYIWLEDYVNYINSPDNIPYMTGILIDITERKEAENIIKKSLCEKEILLREIHHRVNNNLQVISSLLKIQSVYADEEINKEIFKETLNRIRSIAVIHQLTCKSDNLTKIELSVYLTELSKYLKESYNNKEVQFKVNSNKSIDINIDIAVPCGLLINELFALLLNNTCNNSKKVKITCNLNKNVKTEEIIITLHGKNCPEAGKELFGKKSLGLQLVDTLNQQIDGKFKIDHSDGTKFTITFKDNQYQERLY